MVHSAVYAIRNGVNDKVYVGSAVSIGDRWNTHRKKLRRGDHPNAHLQAAWDTYGESAFVFEVLEDAPVERLLEVEQLWIDALCSCDPARGYNLRLRAESNLGMKLSPETRAKLSAARIGNKNAVGNRPSAETLAKRRAKNVGRRWPAGSRQSGWTPERKAAWSARMQGNQLGKGAERDQSFRERVSAAMKEIRSRERAARVA